MVDLLNLSIPFWVLLVITLAMALAHKALIFKRKRREEPIVYTYSDPAHAPSTIEVAAGSATAAHPDGSIPKTRPTWGKKNPAS